MITASTTGWGWEGRALGKKKKKFSKLSSSFALSDANTWRGDGWAAAPPPSRAPLDFPAKDSVCAELSGGRWRRGARVCARVCARVAAEPLPFREPSLGLQEVPKSQWLPGPVSPGADSRHPSPPTTVAFSAPSRPGPAPSFLLRGARPLALSPDARSRSLRTWRLSRAGEPAGPSEQAQAAGRGRPRPGQRPRAPRPAERAVIGAGARVRPAAEGAERAPPVPRERRAARPGSRSARGRPAAKRAPLSDANPRVAGAGRRREGSEAPGECVCRLGAGEGAAGQKRALAVRVGGRTRRRAESGRGDPCGVSLGVPKFLRRGRDTGLRGAGPTCVTEPRALGPSEPARADPRCGECRRVQGDGRSQRAPGRVGNPESGALSSARSASGPRAPGMDAGRAPRPLGRPAPQRSETGRGCVPACAGVPVTVRTRLPLRLEKVELI